MAFCRLNRCQWSLAILVATTCIASAKQQQNVLSGSGKAVPYQVSNNEENGSLDFNFTFDSIDLTRTPNRTLTGLQLLEFDKFEVMNTTAASERGLLARGDLDCAVSKPNALHNFPLSYATPSVIRSNATALAASNLSEYFDVIAFSFKPLGPVPEYTSITVDTWRIDAEVPTYVDGMFVSWLEQTGFLGPTATFPGDHWPGWGQKVNWIEIQAETGDHRPWEFCMDNIVLRFHEKSVL